MKRETSEFDLLLRHRAALIDYATPIVGDRTRAEDIVQEAFIRLMPGPDRVGSAIEQPVAYLYRIVRNLALDWSRRRAVERRREEARPEWWMLPVQPRTPEQEAVHRLDLERIAAALDDLPSRARLALEMHRFGGYTLDEIARRLDVSPATVHRLVRDALLHVAEHLEPPGRIPDG